MRSFSLPTLAFAIACAVSASLTSLSNVRADDDLVAELERVLERRAAIYATDANGSAQVFDELWVNDDNVVLMSEEFHTIFYGREAVTPYFNPPEDNLHAYRVQHANMQATRLSPDLATATYFIRYDMHPVGKPPMGGSSRVMTVFKQTDDGWKIQAEFQMAMSLISQARRLHELAVSPDFSTYARQQNPTYDADIAADEKYQERLSGSVVPWETGGTSQPTAEDGQTGD